MLWNETTTGRRAHFAPLLALVLVVVGCSTPLSTREKGALVGGAVGAGAGAAIGSASGNAGTGALIGDAMQANEQQPVAAPPPPPVSVAPPPPPPVVVAPPPPATVSVEINIGRRPALAVAPAGSPAVP
jgi:hypothetical protein